MNMFGNGMILDRIRNQYPNTLNQASSFFDGLVSAGKLSESERDSFLARVNPTMEKYKKIIPLLDEAEAMLPAYAAKIDAAMLAAGERERIR